MDDPSATCVDCDEWGFLWPFGLILLVFATVLSLVWTAGAVYGVVVAARGGHAGRRGDPLVPLGTNLFVWLSLACAGYGIGLVVLAYQFAANAVIAGFALVGGIAYAGALVRWIAWRGTLLGPAWTIVVSTVVLDASALANARRLLWLGPMFTGAVTSLAVLVVWAGASAMTATDLLRVTLRVRATPSAGVLRSSP